MSGHWNDIRHRAIDFRNTLAVPRQPMPNASAVVAAALEQTDLKACPIVPTHPLLAGAQAVLDPEASRIWYDNTLNDADAHLVIAHEIAHHRLHRDHSACSVAQATMSGHDAASTSGLAVVEGYGPEERKEHEANLFARELLLPAVDARTEFMSSGLRLSDFVKQTGLPEPVLAQHLVYALLVSDVVDDVPNGEGTPPTRASEPDLDPSQRNAAIADGPALTIAGPGTGKTRTLVARVIHLLDKGVDPSSILALTYSNKAAEEMRDRIAAVEPDAAVKMWIGTFHAFGLDVLRRYGTRIGVPEKPEVLTQVDGLLLLERDLNELSLKQYLNLWDPTLNLRDILSVISRAKDELFTPDQFLALANAMATKAVESKDRDEAEDALEVARVYAYYESRVREMGALDFGDLIARSVEVLRHPDGVARETLRTQFRHILVDEFQDVNRASAALLQELAGEGSGLWAVADVRQSIYRFRGAAPNNVRDFATLFPGAKVDSLRMNYRAQPAIVATYSALAPTMKATDAQEFKPWGVARPNTNAEVLMRVAETGEAEGDGIAAEIKRLANRENDAIPYRQQAVLCRSHLTLERIARRLEAAGVPVLYLGDLFEREEVRDLLSLLALACEPDGRSLLRIARFGIYQIPLNDALLLIRTARERNVPFPRALDLLDDRSIQFSPLALPSLNKLKSHVEKLCYGTSAWSLLSRYLLERSDFLETLLGASTLAARQQRLAIFQFLQFALEEIDVTRIAAPDNEFKDPKRIFLDFVRRLAIYGDERQLRQVPEWAAGLDAVRLMTMHGSKGLEFRAVFIPYLGGRYMPSSRRPTNCKPPTGMIPDAEIDTHAEEEECLFFVALSRARDTLCLSRAERYGKQNSNASKLLGAIGVAIPTAASEAVDWPAQLDVEVNENPGVLSDIEEFRAKDLDVYMKCPRRFFYENVLALHDRVSASAYVGFHRVVYDVLGWMRSEVSAGRSTDPAAADQHFQEAWTRLGPLKHPYATLYEAAARALVDRARARLSEGLGEISQPTWVIPLEHGRVSVNPEYVEILDSGGGSPPLLRIRRIRTGKPTATEHEKPLYGLYYSAAEAQHPGFGREIETLYLTTDEVRPVLLTAKKAATRLGKYDRAIHGIRRASFKATPSDRICPRCPNFFICPTAEDGTSPPALGDATSQ
jgi:DNA helicase II / ATP-dependent DNA helicase PcrA